MEPADGRLARRHMSAWKGVRGNFQDFLGDQIKCRGTLASLEGPGKEQIKEAAQERLLENVISSINKDTPEGRHMYQRWTRAQASHHQVCDALRSKNFRRDLSDYAGGTKATRDAVKVFFPEDWCRLLSEDEILAELVVDCATSSIVDSLLDASIELLESHEGWYWPTQHPFRRLQSTPELRVWGSSSPVASWVNQSVTQSPKSFREQVSQPELPPRWRQPVDRSRGSRDLSLSSLSRDLDAPAKGKTLKHFRSAKPFNPFMTRLYSFTDSQRPQRRLQREPRDPFAPKWSFPMMAHHFPEQWNRMVPPSTPKCVTTPVASTRDDADREEEVPPGYTWLQRKVVSDDACDSVSMLQTGYSIEDGLSLESSQGLDAEVASLSNRLVDLTQKFASMENDTARYHETMKLLAHEESHAARQALVAEELDLLLRVSNSNSTTGISGFDTWCLAHSDLVLGVLTFLATSVLIALCIPCGLAPVQIIAWFLSEDKPQVPTVIKETT